MKLLRFKPFWRIGRRGKKEREAELNRKVATRRIEGRSPEVSLLFPHEDYLLEHERNRGSGKVSTISK